MASGSLLSVEVGDTSVGLPKYSPLSLRTVRDGA